MFSLVPPPPNAYCSTSNKKQACKCKDQRKYPSRVPCNWRSGWGRGEKGTGVGKLYRFTSLKVDCPVARLDGTRASAVLRPRVPVVNIGFSAFTTNHFQILRMCPRVVSPFVSGAVALALAAVPSSRALAPVHHDSDDRVTARVRRFEPNFKVPNLHSEAGAIPLHSDMSDHPSSYNLHIIIPRVTTQALHSSRVSMGHQSLAVALTVLYRCIVTRPIHRARCCGDPRVVTEAHSLMIEVARSTRMIDRLTIDRRTRHCR